MFRINPSKTSREDKFVPINQARASVRKKPITVSQPHVITKKDINSESNGLFSTGVDNTAKTRRPQPRSNTKNDRVSSASKSSCIKNKEVKVEEHHRTLLAFKNQKHMSSECNNVKLDIRNDKSKLFVLCVVQIYLWCVDPGCSRHMTGNLKLLINFVWKFLGTVRFKNDHIAGIFGYGDLQWGNIIITRVYFVEGLRYNLFSVGQFCDSNLEGKSKASPQTQTCSKLKAEATPASYGFVWADESQKYQREAIHSGTKKIIEAMNVIFDELSIMAFEQRSSKPGIQGMTYGQINLGLDLTYAPSTITSQKPIEHELKLLFEAMYDDYLGVVDNVQNPMFDENMFANPFAPPSTHYVKLSSYYVDPSNMHMFYQLYQHDCKWTKAHPRAQVIGEPSRPVLTRNQLRTDGEMCTYALSVRTMKPRNVKEAMTNPGWIDYMQEELFQFKRLDVWVLVPLPDNIKPLTLKWLFKNKLDAENTVIRNKTRLVVRRYHQEEGIDFEESFTSDSGFKLTGFLDVDHAGCQDSFKITSGGTQFLGEKLGESLSEAWTRFKDLLLKVLHHGLDLWLQVKIFCDHFDYTTQMAIDYAACGRLRKLRPKVAWETIEELVQYEEEGWNDPIFLEEGSMNYKNANVEQLLRVMESRVDTLMKDAISIMRRSENVFGISNDMMRQLPPEPSHQEAFEDLVMNFILDQEEKVKQLEEYMGAIVSDFMQLSLEVVGKLKEKIRMEENRT
uniref:Integrase, catalytic region, zinc finger, CCHC-type, peptidase aspartic, catalytic n=1 Tax=Tanacetum cinerariifolium TaxID=118510 RepID=A0A6L2KZP0_TANCI|nr:integrase, catalytic region, zinc finger, CCHC-type, peptidase aspartic, catalytic [Tanacetum cinerariifolium]